MVDHRLRHRVCRLDPPRRGAGGGTAVARGNHDLGWPIALGVARRALVRRPGRAGSPARASGPALGIAAGVLLGVANVGVKALTGTVPGDPLSILTPWTA